MNFRLDISNGKVKYIMKQKGGNVGSDTSVDSANWMLKEGKPRRSDEFPGYPIAVTTQNGEEYFFAGEWEAEQSIFTDAQNDAEQSEAPRPRKRRIKDIVLE